MMLKWMDIIIDGSHNSANGHGWIWISSISCIDVDGYGFTNFVSMDMDGYGLYKPHPCWMRFIGEYWRFIG